MPCDRSRILAMPAGTPGAASAACFVVAEQAGVRVVDTRVAHGGNAVAVYSLGSL